jgi:hypothetical protein
VTVDAVADEKELVRKLIFTGHLSVPERKALPGGTAKASLIRSLVKEALRSGRPFRAWWLSDDSMIGSELTYRGDGAGHVGWRYSGVEGERAGVREYSCSAEAADALVREARQLLGDDIDGVPIDWTA